MSSVDQKSLPTPGVAISDLQGDLHFHLAPHGERVGEFTGSHDSEIEGEAFINWTENHFPVNYLVVTDHLERFDDDLGRFHPGDKHGAEHVYDNVGLIEPQLARIKALGEYNLRIRVIAGVEASIQRSGLVNASERMLDSFAVVIASDHYYERGGSPSEVTRRYLTALQNPRVDILGHPGRRHPDWAQIDWNAIARAAALANKAIEINMAPVVEYGIKPGNPEPSRHIEFLKILAKHGVMVSIGGDTHRLLPLRQQGPVQFRQLYELTRLVKDLNRVGIKKSQVLNTYTADELVNWARGNNSR